MGNKNRRPRRYSLKRYYINKAHNIHKYRPEKVFILQNPPTSDAEGESSLTDNSSSTSRQHENLSPQHEHSSILRELLLSCEKLPPRKKCAMPKPRKQSTSTFEVKKVHASTQCVVVMENKSTSVDFSLLTDTGNKGLSIIDHSHNIG